MILTSSHGISFYQFENLARFAGLFHGIFTRNCGTSQPPFDSLNVGFGLGDDPQNIRENRHRIAGCFNGCQLVFADQVHGSQVRVLESASGSNPAGMEDSVLTGDALVTATARKILIIQVADCQAVMLYDPVRKVVGNVHAGWRGSLHNIVGAAVKVMVDRFGCDAGTMVAAIGPSLGPCCAEFINYKTEIPPAYWRYRKGDHHFDFWALSRDQLTAAGVLAANIETGHMCTRCRTDLFFSYRAEGLTGRFAAAIGLK